jgi:dual specificity tyrosine-phosphorylation-regulated kinase 2/3/4
VNEIAHQSINFPIDTQTAKRDKIANKYLTDFERTEIDEYE